MARTFETRIRVRSYELDAQAHVNHAVFLNYFEQARADALEQGGMPWETFLAQGIFFSVVRVEIDYRSEARLGDTLAITTVAEKVGHSSITLLQRAVKARDGSQPRRGSGAGAGEATGGGETGEGEAGGAAGARNVAEAEGLAEAGGAAEAQNVAEPQVVAEARITGVCVGRDGKPRRVPETLRRAVGGGGNRNGSPCWR